MQQQSSHEARAPKAWGIQGGAEGKSLEDVL